jgi:hypothetical protein
LSADKIWVLPSADGTAGQFLKTDGAGNLSFDSLSFSTPLAVIGNATSGSEIRLPEDTDNGSNYVAIKAPDTIASNLTLTLPSADGSSGQVLQTNGSGVLSFNSVGGDFVRLATVTVSGTPTTVSLDGYFSSTYKHYKIMWDKVGGAGSAYLSFRVNISGSANTSSNYYGNHQYGSINSAGGTGLDTYSAGWASTRFELDNDCITGATVNRQTGELILFDPLNTTYSKSWSSQSQSFNSNLGYLWVNTGGGQYINNYSALTGVTFLYNTGTTFLNDGEFRIYGIKG